MIVKAINELVGHLKDPIVFFDLETTTNDVDTAEIVQISVLKMYPNNNEVYNFEAYVMPKGEIIQGAWEVHGITKEFLKEQKAEPFSAIMNELFDVLVGSDLSGYNIIQFDIPVLENEFRRNGSNVDFSTWRITDMFSIVAKVFSKSLTNIYQLTTGKTRPEDAHDAGADVRDTIIVANELRSMFPAIGANSDEWHNYAKEGDNRVDYAGKFTKKDGVYYFNFGSSFGMSVDTNPGLLEWMLDKEFTENTKMWCRRLLDMMYQKPDEEKHIDDQNNSNEKAGIDGII